MQGSATIMRAQPVISAAFQKKKTHTKNLYKHKGLIKGSMESIGGQAVIEGVLIRNKDTIATAVRSKSGKIKVKRQNIRSLAKKHKILSLPIIRGIIMLIETFKIGIESLNFSAKESSNSKEEEIKGWQMFAAAFFSIGIALALFKLLPLAAVQILSNYISLGRVSFSVVEGLLKVGLLLGYIYAISFAPDIKRVFMYHGAEHKAVNCYEKEGKVSIRSAKKYSTVHKRCGTNFVFLVLLVSIFAYILIPLEMSFIAKYGLRLALLPLVAGISYEMLKVNARFPKFPVFSIFIFPGLMVQKITTKEPDDKQLAVAIRALRESLKE